MRKRLAERGIPVYVVTTSHEGIEFLNRFGTPAALLEGDTRIAFDDRQNLDLVGTARRLLHYLANPARLLEGFD
ncbi:MAG: hypothetical protein ABEK29_09370 [Bradymonadaceae bacterium]